MHVGGSVGSDSGETENNLKVGTIFEQLGKSLADGGGPSGFVIGATD